MRSSWAVRIPTRSPASCAAISAGFSAATRRCSRRCRSRRCRSGVLDLRGMDTPPATAAALEALGFHNITGIVATLRGWQVGRIRALRSDRSRELMEQVLPTLLAALGDQPDPDLAFIRFDQMLSRLPAGVQLLSMFQRNPALLDRVASVLGAAPSLAEHLADRAGRARGPARARGVDPDPARTLAGRLPTRARSRTWSRSRGRWCGKRNSGSASARWRVGSMWTRRARRAPRSRTRRSPRCCRRCCATMPSVTAASAAGRWRSSCSGKRAAGR